MQGKSGHPATVLVQALLKEPAIWVWCRASRASCHGIGAGTPGRTCTMGQVRGKSGRPATVLVQALLKGPAIWVWCRASRGVLLWYWCRHSWQDLHHGSGAGQVGASCYGTSAGTPERACNMGLVQGKPGRLAMVLVQALLAGHAQWVWRRASRGVLLWYWCRHSWKDLHNGSGAGQVGASCYNTGAGTLDRACTMGLVQGKSGRPATVLVQALLKGPAIWVWRRASRGVLLWYWCRHSWQDLHHGSSAGQVGASCYSKGAGTPGRFCNMGLAQGKSGCPAKV